MLALALLLPLLQWWRPTHPLPLLLPLGLQQLQLLLRPRPLLLLPPLLEQQQKRSLALAC